jgi:hypothetical protein
VKNAVEYKDFIGKVECDVDELADVSISDWLNDLVEKAVAD